MECMIYPGEFVPFLTEEEVVSALKKTQKLAALSVPVNVTELTDSYNVEVAIPGAKNENLLVYTDNNILTVCVFNKERALQKEEISRTHEFNYDCFERHILLPDNADMSFIAAEYRSGILRVYVPKSDHPSTVFHTRIVVY